VNPFLGEPFAEVSSASPGDVDAAVNAAAAAWESWRRVSGAHRGELLYKLADVLTREHDRLARIETQDNGKIIRETRNQLLFAARCYRFFAGAADKLAGETKPSMRATSTAPWFSTSM
jgi:(Z)-2-((N-methylformamido)methylene)-5-hydroxybutyrolactone dehydrogenase